MILQHVTEMPRLFSGRDKDGHEWTALFIPRRYGEHLKTMNPVQRAKTMRGLMADVRRFSGG